MKWFNENWEIGDAVWCSIAGSSATESNYALFHFLVFIRDIILFLYTVTTPPFLPFLPPLCDNTNRATFIPASRFQSCLWYCDRVTWNGFKQFLLCIHRINSSPSNQCVFILRMSEIDAHFIAFRVTVTPALHAFGESCCKGDMSQKCIWETDEEF